MKNHLRIASALLAISAGGLQTQKIFADVGDGLELAKTQEAAGSFDRVDRAKNIGESFLRRILFELDEFPIEAIEVFVTFNEKFPDNVIHTGYQTGSSRRNAFAGAQILPHNFHHSSSDRIGLSRVFFRLASRVT